MTHQEIIDFAIKYAGRIINLKQTGYERKYARLVGYFTTMHYFVIVQADDELEAKHNLPGPISGTHELSLLWPEQKNIMVPYDNDLYYYAQWEMIDSVVPVSLSKVVPYPSKCSVCKSPARKIKGNTFCSNIKCKLSTHRARHR